MVSIEQLQAVGQSCEDFQLDESLYENKFSMSDSNNTSRSCEICSHWDPNKKICKIDVFDSVLASLDQS
ncbi:MAG: hypothetical protein ACPLW7_00765 [Minisyncoccia bacterium]